MTPLDPLSEKEQEKLDKLLLKYGNDEAILSLSELDGFFAALVSSPQVVLPSAWIPVISGGQTPVFRKRTEADVFYGLMMRYMNIIAVELFEDGDAFEPVFLESNLHPEPVVIVEDWCFGYMRGVQLANWPKLPATQAAHLAAIELHGLEENFSKIDKLTLEEYLASVDSIVEGARSLYRYFLSKR
ncbi:UPF0149 family protein [Pseudomonas sp. MAFF212427]|uniref:UPF0149 family protein n=1 Tax=Pseudomonas brassicae TaxID=2708063 RepID=A0A6B3P110_9PSED|nr:UPF0149 family protein [Pseudomonas brassicae]NER65597.1 UPF0149 family protein [Pseudomonas brassicae]